MINFIARLLLVIAGFFASFFISREELHFPIVTMIIAVLLFTLIVAMIAFWPDIKKWIDKSN